MKKQKNKQGIKASKLAKAENKLKKQAEQVITVKNAEGEPDTQAKILIQNKVNYTPKVSVIIPVYNVEEYLRECLDSVVNQTLKEIEIICVDDGSTDNSLEILKEYAKKDNRISVLTQENLHAGVARNAGLAVAQGEYLSFLDSDDFFELNMLEETYKKAKIDNADIVVFRYTKYDCKSLTQTMNAGANTKILSSNRIISSEICSQYIFQITCPMPWNKIFKREFIEDIKIKYQSITLSNDLYFVFAAISSAIRISYLPNNLMKYRIFKKGSLSGARAKYPFLFLNAFDALYRYLKENGKLTMFYKSFCKILYDSIKWTASQQSNSQEFILKLFESNTIKKWGFNSIDEIKEQGEKEQIIISLTSYPARISTIHITLKSLLNQTMKADKIILWLAPEQFPNKEKDLPKQLLDLREEGLTIDWYHDIKSYKKLIPALKKYPEAIIVTADDDIIYPKNWLELLYKGYHEEPLSISCHRAFRITSNSKAVMDYSTWEKGEYIPSQGNFGIKGIDFDTSYCNFYTSGSGALYPPHLLYKDIYDEDLFLKLAPTEDDVWYWAMAVQNDTPIHVIKDNLGLFEANIYANQEFALYNINSQNDTTNTIFKNIFNYYPNISKKIRQNKEIVISLTSYPARIKTVNQTIESMLNQTMKADKVILWLAPEQFPNKEKDLPQQLLDLRDRGLTIDWYHDIKSYKKLIPTLKKYPESIIVTADDDAIYHIDWLKKLYIEYLKQPNKIHCHRAHRIKMGFNYIMPYKKWEWFDILKPGQDGYDIFFTGVGGVLYPPHSLDIRVLDEEKFRILCPSGDDIWFWGHALLKGTKINLVSDALKYPKLILSTQKSALWHSNVNNGMNDVQMKAIIKKYPQIMKILNKKQREKAINEYMKFPFNLVNLIFLKIKLKKSVKKVCQKNMQAVRIDIKNYGKDNNAVEITASAKVSQPNWFANTQGIGQVIETNKKSQDITIKAIQDGKLVLSFRGQDKRFEGTRFPVWADYKSIKIDGKEILSAPISTWHDKPFRYEMPVKDGQVVKVDVVQQYHQYDKDELKDVILKLNPNSEYIKENIKKLTNKIYKKITVNNTTIKSSPQTTLFARVKQNVQEKIKLWQDKLSFAHKIAPIMEMMQKNQAQTLQILQEIQTKNVNLENKNNELKKEIEVLKGFFSTQLTDFKKQQEERSKQLLATGDRLSAELQRATAELQSAEQSQTSEIKATLSEFIAQLAVTENKLSAELQRATAELQNAEQSQASEIKAKLSEFIAQLVGTENKLSAELQRATEELQNSGISEISEIKTYCADFAHQLGNTEVKLLNELNNQRETSQQNKNNIIAGINQTEQSLQTQVAKSQELVQEQQTTLNRVQERLEDLSTLKEIDFAQKSEINVLSQDIEKQKSQLLERVQNLQNKAQLQYQELNFADLLHDSTQNSPWLKDKNFALYGAAANYGFIYTLFRILDNVQPAHILEMGLGQTSMVTTQYVANNQPEADLDIIENDESWIKIYEPKLAKSQNIKLHQCDIEFFDYEGEQSRKYKELNKITGDKKYNMIIVDGPFGGAQKLPRSNIVDLVEHNLAQDFIIIFDDAERAGEQNTIALTKAKLASLGIEFGFQQRNALKSQVLIFSKSCEFAKYL